MTWIWKRGTKPRATAGTAGCDKRSAAWLESSLAPLRLFHRLGLRELQLTWAFPNALVPDGHLSRFGHDVVAECGRLGIVVDATHIAREAFDEVVEETQRPIIAAVLGGNFLRVCETVFGE